MFAGNILALTSITMNDGVTLNGRALARNGAVTLINDTITAAHCGRDPARELDVSRALPAAAGTGANQGLRPNQFVGQALVAAGVDPTRANWTRSTWTRRPGPVVVDQVDLDAASTWTAAAERHRRAVGGRDLDVRHVHERRPASSRPCADLDLDKLVEPPRLVTARRRT